jgi:hypothetical protein
MSTSVDEEDDDDDDDDDSAAAATAVGAYNLPLMSAALYLYESTGSTRDSAGGV